MFQINYPIRLNKFLSMCEVSSRREADRLVREGNVKINKTLAKEPYEKVNEEDKIFFKGRMIQIKDTPKIFIYYKPRGLIITHNDPLNRRTVFEEIKYQHKDLPRLISVGRLDINSEGLLLLTNSGEISQNLERSDCDRVYKVRVFGSLTDEQINFLKKGITISGVKYKEIIVDDLHKKINKKDTNNKKINESIINKRTTNKRNANERVASENSKNRWYLVKLNEGKNREIRKVFENFGCKVNKLVRLSYGQFKIGNLKPGEIIEVKQKYGQKRS